MTPVILAGTTVLLVILMDRRPQVPGPTPRGPEGPQQCAGARGPAFRSQRSAREGRPRNEHDHRSPRHGRNRPPGPGGLARSCSRAPGHAAVVGGGWHSERWPGIRQRWPFIEPLVRGDPTSVSPTTMVDLRRLPDRRPRTCCRAGNSYAICCTQPPELLPFGLSAAVPHRCLAVPLAPDVLASRATRLGCPSYRVPLAVVIWYAFAPLLTGSRFGRPAGHRVAALFAGCAYLFPLRDGCGSAGRHGAAGDGVTDCAARTPRWPRGVWWGWRPRSTSCRASSSCSCRCPDGDGRR